MTKRRILVIDDSATDCLHAEQALGARGHEVQSVHSAQDALGLLEQAPPDLIVLDVVMPGTNGFQFTRWLSSDSRYSAIPIVLCTSKSTASDRIWGLRQGASAYLVKPVASEQLCRTVDSLLGEIRR